MNGAVLPPSLYTFKAWRVTLYFFFVASLFGDQLFLILDDLSHITREVNKGGYTLVTLPRIVTPYRNSVDETRGRVTYQKLATR